MTFVLGLDIGTSSTKAAVFDPAGVLVVTASTRYPCYSPQPGWYEQEPADWLQGVYGSIRQVTKQINPNDIKAVGLCGQSPSHVLVDSDGNPLGRGIIWRDHRAVQEAEWLKNNLSSEEMQRWDGVSDISEVIPISGSDIMVKEPPPGGVEAHPYIAHPKDFAGLH